MELCSDKHDEVCFESGDCPVCGVLSILSDLEDKLSDYEEKIKELEAQ